LDIETQPKWRTVAWRRSDSDDGVILVEFALVSVVFFALVFGGLFVLMTVIAKGQVVSGVTTGAQLAASDNFQAPKSSSCLANPPPGASGGTLDMVCEIEQSIGSDILGTNPASLEVAIECVDQGDYSVSCQSPQLAGVRVCARTWVPWDYPVIVSPGWIASANEQATPTTPGFTLGFSNYTPPGFSCP
jgi:hypothetical protein